MQKLSGSGLYVHCTCHYACVLKVRVVVTGTHVHVHCITPFQYLRELKRYFDEKVYICLYEYFYDPTDDVEGQYNVTSRKQVDFDLLVSSRHHPLRF